MGDPRQRGWTEEFKREAVRLLSTSGRPVGEVAADLGVGKSTLTHWRRRLQETELLAGPHLDAEKELARLRRENEILRQERGLLKSNRLLRQGDKSMKFRLIDAEKATAPVPRLCSILGVSASGYYAWKGRIASRRQREDLILLAHIRGHFTCSNETYGSPRMHAELKAQGLSIGRHRVARLMRNNGLKALQKRRFKRTTDSQHTNPVAPNLLEQDFTTTGPNQKWGSDISYIWTAEGWLYLAIVVDLYSRRIVGWAVGDRLKKELPMAALQRALVLRRPPPGLVQHSDRGSQYCSGAYQKMLRDADIAISMSGRGNCFDNSMVETVFKTLKAEMVWRTTFLTRQQAELALGRYIDSFYNPRRRHSALGYQSPCAFEAVA
ncbi:IS3 family transposase [Pseudoroseomonas wenyumeiae]